MFIKFNWYWLIVFCVILTLVCSSRACHMWLTRNHMFIREIWEKFTSFIVWNFEISLVSLGRFQSFKKVNSVNLSQISRLNMWSLALSTWLSEIYLMSLIALFWNFRCFEISRWWFVISRCWFIISNCCFLILKTFECQLELQ